MDADPVTTNPTLYRVIFENERVRVLEYRDVPGDRSVEHGHPDSVMVTLGSFRRRLEAGERTIDVELGAGEVRWLPEQHHIGENIGDTPTHVVFVELKESRPGAVADDPLGPADDATGRPRAWPCHADSVGEARTLPGVD